ncbi:GNAT family N-acetyltransferase [Kibdelosporangium persicum]|uniref:N-acetyltransferase n=1 Tax=Kibdelosporangium persicum TaxID=2698649 RepID=A0ABX2F2G2_9PSEU|nr:GNAT family N-acetyltransferase [Kibdelosporangium persicum]NRN65025.1 N-acetyltransferase [Kibdelosporangium persicum]
MRISGVTATQLDDLRTPLHAMYRQCFADPPWNEPPEMLDDYANVLSRHLGQPGLYGSVAWSGKDLLGVAYGHPMPPDLPDDPFHHAVAEVVSPSSLVAPAVTLIELMVSPAARGRGVGRGLIDHFVRDHDQAWLVTHPEAPACRLYESAGWTRSAPFANPHGGPRVAYLHTK